MKKIFPIIVVLCSFYANAQTYQFDKVITTETNGVSSQNMVYSGDDNYVMFLRSENLAEIFDRKSKIKHEFTITYSNNDEISLKYVRSCDESIYFTNYKNSSKFDYRVEKINENEFILGKYKSGKSKNPKCEIHIKIEESDLGQINFLHIIENEYIEELKTLLEVTKNYTITEMDFSSTGGQKIKLINVINYNFSVELPKDLIFECKNNIPALLKN